jgi:hypothetical protein
MLSRTVPGDTESRVTTPEDFTRRHQRLLRPGVVVTDPLSGHQFAGTSTFSIFSNS